MEYLEYNKDIYKKIRYLFDKTCKDKICILAEEKIEEIFKNRFVVNNWKDYFTTYYLLVNLNKTTLQNWILNKDIFDGIILDLKKEYPLNYIDSIINDCINNKINIYLCNFPSENQENNEYVHFIGGINEL